MDNLRKVTQDEVTEYLVTLLESVEEEMRTTWQVYDQESDGSGKHLKIFSNLQEQLIYTPSVEIIEKGDENEIISVGTQTQTMTYQILISTANNHPIESKKYNRVISSNIFELLNDFEHRSFVIPGKNFCSYWSEASRMEMGFRRGKGVLTCSIEWSCKFMKPNRFGTITPC